MIQVAVGVDVKGGADVLSGPEPIEQTLRGQGWRGWVRDRRVTNTLGTGLVLACLLVPYILSLITDRVEAGEIRVYSEAALNASSAGGTNGLPQAPRTTPLDDHFFFIAGCVGDPSECVRGGPGNWLEYYTELGEIYGTWPKEDTGAGGMAYDEWAGSHVTFLGTTSSDLGVYELRRAFDADKSGGAIHAVGTSAGGSALISYLSKAMRGEFALDPRLRDVLAVDAPLGFQPPISPRNLWFGIEAGAMRADVWPGFGWWVQQKGIAILLVDTPNDVVGHDPIPGLREDAKPVYPGPDVPPTPGDHSGCDNVFCSFSNLVSDMLVRSRWHNYTGGHVALSSAQFMRDQWK